MSERGCWVSSKTKTPYKAAVLVEVHVEADACGLDHGEITALPLLKTIDEDIERGGLPFSVVYGMPCSAEVPPELGGDDAFGVLVDATLYDRLMAVRTGHGLRVLQPLHVKSDGERLARQARREQEQRKKIPIKPHRVTKFLKSLKPISWLFSG